MSTSQHPAESQKYDPDATETIPFDWRKLLALGLSSREAQSIAKALAVREMMPVYWRQLIESGIPLNDAKIIAKAIANFDARRKLPTAQQKQLIMHYCSTICRADLWRTNLL